VPSLGRPGGNLTGAFILTTELETKRLDLLLEVVPTASVPANTIVTTAAIDAPHSITSSARASSDGGTVRPSALAVRRLIRKSNLVACCTGRSAGFSPLRIRPT